MSCHAEGGCPLQMDGCRLFVDRAHPRNVGQRRAELLPFRRIFHRFLVDRQFQAFGVSRPPDIAVEAAKQSEAESERSRSDFGSSRSQWHSRRARSPILEGVPPEGQTEAFVQRARKRLQAHDAARQQLVYELTDSESRLSRLQEVARPQEAPIQTPPQEQPDMVTQTFAANGESVARRKRCYGRGIAWPCGETPGETAGFHVAQLRCCPAHADVDSSRFDHLDAGSPIRAAGGDDRGRHQENFGADVSAESRRRETCRVDRRHAWSLDA